MSYSGSLWECDAILAALRLIWPMKKSKGASCIHLSIGKYSLLFLFLYCSMWWTGEVCSCINFILLFVLRGLAVFEISRLRLEHLFCELLLRRNWQKDMEMWVLENWLICQKYDNSFTFHLGVCLPLKYLFLFLEFFCFTLIKWVHCRRRR